jgi:drug/metabolite transporter (DMT)-like permease
MFESPDFSNLLNCVYAVLFAGIFASGLSYSMQLYAQRHVNASISALLMSTESVFAAFGGVILLNESMNSREILGAGLILIAIIFVQSSNIIQRNSKTKTKTKSN